MKHFFLFLLFINYLFGQSNPKIYSTLSDRLFDAGDKFELLKYDAGITTKINAYTLEMQSVYGQGLHLDSKIDISSIEKKEYLASLRKLEKNYKNIVYSLQQIYLNSIKNNDYNNFIQISSSGIDDIFRSRNVFTKARTFYQKNKDKGAVDPLDQLIYQSKLERQSRQEQNNTTSLQKSHNTKRGSIYLDQENVPVGSRGGLEITRNQSVAQSFSITKTGSLISMDIVDIKHHRCTPTKSLYISLIKMENEKLGAQTFYTRELHSNEISSTVKLSFGSYAPSVKPGEQYAIYLSSDAEPSGCTYAWGGGIETYENGKTFVNQRPDIRDMKFRTYILEK